MKDSNQPDSDLILPSNRRSHSNDRKRMKPQDDTYRSNNPSLKHSLSRQIMSKSRGQSPNLQNNPERDELGMSDDENNDVAAQIKKLSKSIKNVNQVKQTNEPPQEILIIPSGDRVIKIEKPLLVVEIEINEENQFQVVNLNVKDTDELRLNSFSKVTVREQTLSTKQVIHPEKKQKVMGEKKNSACCNLF